MKYIFTDKAPKVVGPYSQAIIHNDTIYCSGQIGIDPKVGTLVKGIEAQTKQVLANLQQVLTAAGSDKSKVIRATIFMANMEDYVIMNTLYEEFFASHKPTRATVQVAKLPAGALVEIDMIAIK